VRVSDYRIASESFYARTDGKNWPYNAAIRGSLPEVWARRGVAEKLAQVNQRLAPHGAELFAWDGYRPIDTQRALWEFFELQAARDMPGATSEAQREQVLRYVSDPTRLDRADPATWPTHTTGAAIDLTLRNLESRELLDMGAAFDEMSATSHSDALEHAYAAGRIEATSAPLKHRRLLHWAMEAEGFVNFPLEYWHFDWGNQMYVHNLTVLKKEAPEGAWYGYVDPPTQTS
jgi:D-alanyl-D-alanine dipeptidase